MKKLIVAIFIGIIALSLASCEKEPMETEARETSASLETTEHTHDFSAFDTENPNQHYYRCKDDDCKEISGSDFHNYVLDRISGHLKCSVCGRIAK